MAQANPAIDMDGYLRVSREAAEHRQSRRVSEEEFIRMSREPGSVILDARSREKFEELFITGADKAAGAVLRAVERDKRRVLVGPDAYVIDAMARLLPGAYQHIVKRFVLKALS
jgi:hypothetical protein